MLSMKHDKPLPEAFNISKKERDLLLDVVDGITANEKSVTWTIQRIWIDERFSDNLKAAAIFLLGYSYATNLKGGDDKWTK